MILSDNIQPVHLSKLPLPFTIIKTRSHVLPGGWVGSRMALLSAGSQRKVDHLPFPSTAQT